LAPQQVTSNNISRCFNWLESGDATREQGEALSIRNMIAQVIESESELAPLVSSEQRNI
tara:strand:+ start:10493 stop:10669 length:177 start_codon:yes stop_codon:yes gene_type:complete